MVVWVRGVRGIMRGQMRRGEGWVRARVCDLTLLDPATLLT